MGITYSCEICKKKVAFFQAALLGVKFDNSYICSNCMKKSGLSSTRFYSNEIKSIETIKTRIQDFQNFTPVEAVENYIHIDYDNQLVKIYDEIFKFSNVLSYEFVEDGKTIKKGGASLAVGNAVIGGVLFGGVGALVGAATGLRNDKNKCTSMIIKVQLSDPIVNNKSIELIGFPVQCKVNGGVYNQFLINAKKCCSKLDTIISYNNFHIK